MVTLNPQRVEYAAESAIAIWQPIAATVLVLVGLGTGAAALGEWDPGVYDHIPKEYLIGAAFLTSTLGIISWVVLAGSYATYHMARNESDRQYHVDGDTL